MADSNDRKIGYPHYTGECYKLVPRNSSRGRGVIPSLAEREGAVLSADVSVGTTSLECSVLECGHVYSMLCC
jgi:hypothetical protein